MSRATGGARPWNESAGRVGQRHLPRPPTSALIDAPRQSNFRLRASFFVAIITTATTPDSHPDCRALLIQIVALQLGEVHPVRRLLLSANQNDTRAALSPLRRQNPREEPGALAAHAGICTGGGWQRPSLP